MNISSAALALDFTDPAILAARNVRDALDAGGSLNRQDLISIMTQSYGSTAADGRWSLRDAYDVLELAQVLHLATADLPANPSDCVAALTTLTASLPTHTVRSEEQIALSGTDFEKPVLLAVFR